MSDLFERLKKYLDLIPDDLRYESPNDMIALLDECLAALSPVLPDEAKAIWCYLRANGQTDAADLLERQAREIRDHTAYTESLGILHERIKQLEDDNIKDIKTTDVLHVSFDYDGELKYNFAIIDTLLERIKELEERQMQHDSIDIANAESIEMLQAKIGVFSAALKNAIDHIQYECYNDALSSIHEARAALAERNEL